MYILKDITNIVNQAKKRLFFDSNTAKKAISVLDLTSLNNTDTVQSVKKLCTLANTPAGNTAAVCIYPHFVENCYNLLKKKSINIATVVNFPSGNENPHKVEYDTMNAIQRGATEIDCVFPYEYFIKNDLQYVENLLKKVRKICSNNIKLKIILETGKYKNLHNLYNASCIAIQQGADFIKTSTGKIQIGATVESAITILKSIQDHQSYSVGCKISGGVKNIKDVAIYFAIINEIMGNNWIDSKKFRFGASSILGELVKESGFKQDTNVLQNINY